MIYILFEKQLMSIIFNESKYNLILKGNFYNQTSIIDINIMLDLLPELLIVLFIFYNLINLFNNKTKVIFQYYKWIYYFIILLFVLGLKLILLNSRMPEIIFGFSWLNSYYVLISKIIILLLTICILYISQNKIKYFLKLNYFIEFPLIIGFSVLFMFILLSSYDFFGVYLAIEGLSLTLYVLSALLHQGIISIEAGIKYFSLGAIASGSLLLGISILFGLIGSLDFLEIQNFLGSQNLLNYIFETKISLTLIFFSFFFKISAFPCHVWVADVYEGVWTPITAFFAIVIKCCLILFFIRLLFDVLFNVLIFFQPLFILSALGSIFIGSFGALKQVRIKRFLAYTSISQVGFILLGIVSGNILGLFASILYLALYIIMSLIFFCVFLNIEHIILKKNIIYLSDLYGLSYYTNEASKHLALTILSMAGLPPLGGFIGKLFLYFAIIESRLDFILWISLIISLISTYYYLNFARYLFFEKHIKIKLYYFVNKISLIFILRIGSFILISFIIFLSNYLDFFFKLSFSCIWPFI